MAGLLTDCGPASQAGESVSTLGSGEAGAEHVAIMAALTGETQAAEAPQAEFPVPQGVFAETVTAVKHFTDRMFMFRMTRPRSFRFRSGEFVMIGLPNAERPVYRAYSIASPSWDDELEFFSIKVPDGPLTQHLQKICIGDTILMRRKPTGTLVNDALLPGRRLFLFSTGTGIAPFASIVRDPETYEKFESVILTHTCRLIAELKYGQELVQLTYDDPLVSEQAAASLIHYPTVTREDYPMTGRITDLINSGKLFSDIGIPSLGKTSDRCMICGSMAMLRESKQILLDRGFVEGANSAPADFVIERAFVD